MFLNERKARRLKSDERRRELLNKWRPYLHSDLPCDKATSYLKSASFLVEKACDKLRDSKFPASQLLSAKELSYQSASDSTVATMRDYGAINEAASHRFLSAASKSSSSFGKVLRSGFYSYTNMKHEVHRLQSSNSEYRCDPSKEKKAAIPTRASDFEAAAAFRS
jgi:hypothetical protein